MRLTVVSDRGREKSIEVGAQRFVIGRDGDCDLTLDDSDVSRHHLEITKADGGQFQAMDLDSANGTLINGRPLTAPVVLRGGDELKLGNTTLKADLDAGETRLAAGETRLARGAGETRLAAPSKPMTLQGSAGPGKGMSLAPTPAGITVGRDTECDAMLDDEEVSRRHAKVLQVGDQLEISDLDSRNGTFVNGRRITEPTPLKGGETVKIGETSFRVEPDKSGQRTEPGRKLVAPVQPAQRAAAQPAAAQPAARPSPRPSPGVRAPGQPPPTATRGRGPLIVALVAVAGAIIVAALAVSGAFSGGGSLSDEEIADKGETATLLIITRTHGVTPQGNPEGFEPLPSNTILGSGSGWVYDAEEGIIVTNAHVVVGGGIYQAGFGSGRFSRATLLGVDFPNDIAVLQVAPAILPGLSTMERADPKDIQQGEAVFALGFPGSGGDPLANTYSFSPGALTRIEAGADVGYGFFTNENSALHQNDLYQTDAAINPGNSGGPLVDDQARLVGMNYATGPEENQGLGVAIPVAELNNTVPRLAGGESLGWPGFNVSALPTEGANSFGLNGAVVITSVVRDSPADQAGLTQLLADATNNTTFGVPDPVPLLIAEVDNVPVNTLQQYVDLLAAHESGEEVEFTVVINGSVQRIGITIR